MYVCVTYSEFGLSGHSSHFHPCPGALTQAIRNFAKSLESWLTNAMMNIPEEMVRIKVHSLMLVLTAIVDKL